MPIDYYRKREIPLIVIVLVLAVVHGMIYIFLLPPWQHYDEPTHFEHAWMLANKGEFPVSVVIDWDFRADLVRSMISHGFYEGEGLVAPDPENLNPVPAGIRYSQLEDPPLYYLLASLPLRIMKTADLADQLLSARAVSLGIYLLTIVAAWGVMRTLTRPGSPLRIFVPLMLALLPGFVDLMTAVNNDVGAVLVFTVFFWTAVRLIRYGFSIPDFLAALLVSAAAAFTKSTAYPVVLLFMMVVILSLVRGGKRKFAWALLGAGALAGALVLTYSGEAAYWYRAVTQTEPVRIASPDAPHGSQVISLNPGSDIAPRWLRMLSQPLAFDDVPRLAGQRLTLGFWMWYQGDPGETPELTVRPPAVRMDIASGEDVIILNPVIISDTPRFFTVPIRVPRDVLRIWVFLHPQLRDPAPDLRILFDGLVLAAGEFPPGSIPNFTDLSGTKGTWDGRSFENLLRNASAENAWIALRPEADNLLSRVLPDNIRLSNLLFSVLDTEGAGWYYRATASHLLETFYGKFGWGHIPLVYGHRVYTALIWLSLVGAVGTAFYPLQKKWRREVRDPLVFFLAAMVVVWAGAFARGAIFIFVSFVFIPSARYAYPVILPTVLMLVTGWFAWGYRVQQWLKLPDWTTHAVFAVGSLLLAGLGMYSILAFYG